MSRRRPPHCRRPFVVPVMSDPIVDTRSGREVIEEALEGFTTIGRDLVGAATAALVDAAAGHGFAGPEWEASAIRPAIVEIVAPRMHDLLVEVMRPEQHSGAAVIGQDALLRQDAAPRSEGLRTALVDQLLAVVSNEFEQYGVYPKPGHVERLRECLRELVSVHWSGGVEPGAETDVKSVLLTDRVQVANTIIPLLRDRGSEREPE